MKFVCLEVPLIFLFFVLGACVVPRKNLFEIWISEPEKSNKNLKMMSYVLNRFNVEGLKAEVEDVIMEKIVKFGYKLGQKWKECRRTRARFINNNKEWLESNMVFPELESYLQQMESQPSTSRGPGRPPISFETSSEKSKRRKIQPLLEKNTHAELIYATQATLHSAGKRDAAQMLKEMVTTSPKRATHIKQSFHSPSSAGRKLTKDEALATFLDGKMTKSSYTAIQKRLKSVGSKVLPSYPFIREAKEECYPNDIVISEISAEVSLQSLINHTTKRLCQVQRHVLLQHKDILDDVELIFKWGCDGTSGLTPYKQRFTDDKDKNLESEDTAIFVLSLVPLQLRCRKQGKKKNLWQNPTPSSTKYCRPIKLLLRSESTQLIKEETEKIEEQIRLLSSVHLVVEDKEMHIIPVLLFTMVDGKVCSSMLHMSSQKCYICGCSPKEMNNRPELSTADNPESYKFGISPLHAKIRIFECLLKISYRLEIKKWQVRGADKEKVEQRKSDIQQKFRSQMGLLVDVVKQGFGTTNDGNTARRFFQDPALSSSITGIDETLISMLSVLLQAISCGYEIDAEAFQRYALNTLNKYLEHYSWYYMPPTLHKILIHGPALIKHALLPLGQLAEDAQESRHKELKKYRESHSRKYSRKATMEDVMHLLFVTSDSVISSLRTHTTKSLNKLTPELRALLKSPVAYASTDDDDGDDDISTEDEYLSTSDSE